MRKITHVVYPAPLVVALKKVSGREARGRDKPYKLFAMLVQKWVILHMAPKLLVIYTLLKTCGML